MIEALNGYVVSQRLREDDQFVLLRARRLADDVPVLLLGARDGRRDSGERIEREFALRGELDPGFAAIPLALADSASGPVLVLADCGAAPLSTLPPVAMPARAFLSFALNLTRALASVHQRNLVHKDLRPEHILVQAGSGRVRLTGFGGAARVGAVPRGPDGYRSGSLPYMAPEQTGRVKRPVDTRTDLYSLGVVLYQLLCGQLPFAAAGPAQWIDCHVARAPQACAGTVDRCCAAIVMKLLAKAPEQRYQSTDGLQADLAHCLALLRDDAPAAPFALGRSDGVMRPQAGGALVGRAGQLAVLEQTLQRAACGLAVQPVLVCGPAGSGKSALIDAFGASAAGAGMHVMHIRFEAHLQGTPYAALGAGFRAPRGARARLGRDAGLLAHALPELGRSVRTPMPGVAQAQRRMQDSLRRLVALCASEVMPLLLCFDDLQWADPASLALLTALVTGPALPHVMVVGSVRGLAGAPHLVHAGEQLRRHGVRARRLMLPALGAADSTALVAAALNCSAALCAPLADTVHARSGGNPLFAVQLLTRLAETGVLRHEGGRWQWDGAALAACHGLASLDALLAARLQQLPYATLDALKLLACLGRQASVATLARVGGMSEDELDELLWPAARLGLLQRAPGQYAFQHNAMRETALALLGPRALPERHLHIGRVLAHGARGDAVFAAAGHMNRGQDAMDESEMRSLARINGAAGKRAREALALHAARSYYRAAVAHTTESAWIERPEATLALHLALAECEQHCGGLEQAASILAHLDWRAAALTDWRPVRSSIALRRVTISQALGRDAVAAALGLDALAWFGLHFPEDDASLDAAVAAERAAIGAARPIAGDADADAAMVTALCAEMGPSVSAVRPQLYRLLAARALHFVLRHGSSEASCTIYARYAIMLAALGDVDQAFVYACQARSAAPSPLRRARMDFVHAAFVQYWREPLGSAVVALDAAAGASQAAGDLAHAGQAAHVSLWYSFEAGVPLAVIARRAQGYEKLAQRQGGGPLLQLLRCHAGLARAMQGAGGELAGRAALASMHAGGDGVTRTCALVLRQVTAYMFGLFDEARAMADQVAAEHSFVTGAVHEGSHRFFHALTLAALHGSAPQQQRAAMVAAVRAAEAVLREQALRAPANFSGRYLVVAAELARIEGRDLDAMRSYDAALALARASGLQQQEALAADLAARFHAARGVDTSAMAYAAEAWSAWARWGATARMRALEAMFPALEKLASALPWAQETEAALEVCQALAQSRDLARLASRLLRYAVPAGGASRGLLLLPGDGGLRAVAQARAGAASMCVEQISLPLAAVRVSARLSLSVLHMRRTLVVDDALSDAALCGERALQLQGARALLCIPLSSQGMTVGLLYLEHSLMAGVFHPQRVRLLELVAAQAALVLDRERLVAALDLEWLRRTVAQEALADGIDCLVQPQVSMTQINT